MNTPPEKKRTVAAIACVCSCLSAAVVPFVFHTGLSDVVKGLAVGVPIGVSTLAVVVLVKLRQADQA